MFIYIYIYVLLAHTTLPAPPCPTCPPPPPLPTNKGSNQMASEKRLNVSTDCVKDFRPYAPPCPAPPHTTPTLSTLTAHNVIIGTNTNYHTDLWWMWPTYK